jgi:class 3 adenylate cyclase
MGLLTGPAVTFLFTDIEASTRLERLMDDGAMSPLREIITKVKAAQVPSGDQTPQ